MPIDQVKPVVKSRFKRLFGPCGGEIEDEFEPSSVCLAKMVRNFIEENHDKQQQQSVKCSRNRCNCFHGICSDSSDDEFYSCHRRHSSGDSVNAGSSTVTCEVLKSIVSCVSKAERNLLADTTRIVDKSKICNCKRKEECRKIVIEGLLALNYDASICKSQWERSISPLYPSGEYEYIDVIIEGERLLIDIDFKSEFEIARSTGTYRSILQSLPSIFVGKVDRLQQIVSIVSDSAKQSLKKKGMHIPPWRKTEYMRSKWLSPYTRTTKNSIKTKSFSGEFELIFKDFGEKCVQEEKITVVVTPWEPPAVKPKSSHKGAKIVAGLASILEEKKP